MDAPSERLDRAALIDRLDALEREGAIDAVEHAGLLRHFDDLQRDLRDAVATLEPEYQRRAAAEGREDADRWLSETAESLGRRHGQATRTLLERLTVVAGNPA